MVAPKVYDLVGLGDVLSLDNWNTLLNKDEQLCLIALLPNSISEGRATITLSGRQSHHPLPFNHLVATNMEVRVWWYKDG
jgi:hypothetical protein